MKYRPSARSNIIFAICLCVLSLPQFLNAQQLRFNYPYVCNKERIVVARCRKDSDMPGYPATRPEEDYCHVDYPDRPLRGGITPFGAVLRNDLIRQLHACGAFGERPGQTSSPTSPRNTVNDAVPVNLPASDSAVQHYEQGKRSWDDKEYAKAITELEKAIAITNDKTLLVPAFVYLGDSYNVTRQYAKTISLMQKAIMLQKESAYYNILGDAYERTMQLPKAMAAFKEAVRISPTSAVFLSSLGANLVLNGRIAEARQVHSALLQIDKDEAKYLLDDIENKQGPAGVLVKRAKLALIGRDEDEAIEWFRNAAQIKTSDIDVLTNIGNGLDIYEKYDEALTVYRRILALNPPPKEIGMTRYFIGQTYNHMKAYGKALPELTEAIRLNPGHYAINEIGLTYFNLGQFPKALSAFQEALKMKSDAGDTQLMIGRTYEKMDRPEDALAAYTELTRMEPKYARGHVEIGRLNFDLKRYPDAGRAFSTALRIQPSSAAALAGIGRTFLAVGRKPDAMRAYSALKGIDEKLAKELLDEINRLRD